MLLETPKSKLNTAIHANGDHKKIHQASLELIRMLEFMALTALAAFGAKGNAVKGLKIASEIKLPPMGGQPALATADGGKLETPQNNTNVNEARATQQTQSTSSTTQTNTSSTAARWTARITELEPIYGKYSNWVDVKTKFLGKPASETNLPPGYKYARIGSKQYAYLAKTDPDKVPLLKTNIKSEWDLTKDKNPSSRLAEKTRYDAAYGTKVLKTGSQIHHLVADNVWRGVEVYQEALRRGIAHMDVKANLIELAETPADLARARQIDPKFSEVLHQSQHPEFDNFVRERVLNSVEKAENTLNRPVQKWTDIELKNFIRQMEDFVRDLFMNHPDQLPKKSNGTLGFVPKPSEMGAA
jgi:A nuclease family of the HNH/ENDO VII superfamily with conserved AHH